jgi:hypothetical protein
MSILENIDFKFKEALKSRNEMVLNPLRMLRSIIKNKEIETHNDIQDKDIVDILYSEIKKRKESSDLYKKAGREDLSSKEEAEIKIISEFLPEQLSDDDLTKFVSLAITEVGASSLSDMGKIMANVMPKIKGKASGADISKKVSQLLGK